MSSEKNPQPWRIRKRCPKSRRGVPARSPRNRKGAARRLAKEQDGAGALDCVCDAAMQVRRDASQAARQDSTALDDEAFQQFGIFVVDGLDHQVDTATRHRAIGPAHGGAAFGCLGLHVGLFGLAVQRVAAEMRIVFLFLQPARRARALFVAGAHVARDRLAFGGGLGALESNDVLCHGFSVFAFGRGFLVGVLTTFLLDRLEETDDRLADTAEAVFLFDSALALDGETRERAGFEAGLRNVFAAHLADTVGALGEPLERFVDFEQRVLLLRKETEREIAVIGVAARIGLVQSVGRDLVGIVARAEIIARHTGHGIEQRVLEGQQAELLLFQPWVESAGFVDRLAEGEHVAHADERSFGCAAFGARGNFDRGRFFGGCLGRGGFLLGDRLLEGRRLLLRRGGWLFGRRPLGGFRGFFCL